jgi:hypothetical protein
MMKMFKLASDSEIRAAGKQMIEELKKAGVDLSSQVHFVLAVK